MKVLLEGPILTNSGYGEHCRLVYRSIKSLPGIELLINPLNWGKTSWKSLQDQERIEIDECVKRYSEEFQNCKNTNTSMNCQVQIFVGIPNEFEKKAPYSVCVTAGIETDRVSPNWLIKTHQGINKLIVPSTHSENVFKETQYEILNHTNNQKTNLNIGCPIEVVPYPVKNTEPKNLDLSFETDFNFLSVALLGPRKNMEFLIKCFVEEFKDENVGLVLKTSTSGGPIMDRDLTVKHLKSVLAQKKDRKCKVYLLHGDLQESELHSLYGRSDLHAFATTTCGEGYGLPLFEAAYSGMPIAATDWSGHVDFLKCDFKENGKIKNKKLFAKIEYELKPIPESIVWENVLIKDSKWAYPTVSSTKKRLRDVYKNYGRYKKWAKTLQESIHKTHSEEVIFEKLKSALFTEQMLEKLNEPQEDFFWFDEESEIKKYD